VHSLAVDAILFDIDGTLVDERRSYREAVRLTAEHVLGESVSEQDVELIKQLPGLNNDWHATWALIQQRRSDEPAVPNAEEQTSSKYLHMRNVFQAFYLGSRMWRELSGEDVLIRCNEPLMMRETPLLSHRALDALTRFPLGIVTSRPRPEALMAVRQHGYDAYFPEALIVAMEDAPREKPYPDGLIQLVRTLKSAHPVYVGDTINDALAAAAAGMPFVFVGRTPLAERPGEIVDLPDVNTLPRMLRQWRTSHE